MSLDEVLKSLDKEYLEKIPHRVSGQGLQKTLTVNRISVNAGDIKDLLKDRLDFERRLNSLSPMALRVFQRVFGSGYSFKVQLQDDQFDTGMEECLDKFITFPIPAGNGETMLILPLEYAIYSLGKQNLGQLSLLKALIMTYTSGQITRIGRNTGIRKSGDKIGMAIELCKGILNGAAREIGDMNEKEKTLFHFIEDNEGVVSLDIIQSKFHIGIQTMYSGTDAGALLGSSMPTGNPLTSLLLKGLVIPERGDRYNEIKAIAIPEEIYISILGDRLSAVKRVSSRRNGKEKPPAIRIPDTKIFENLKATIAAIYFLQTRSKRMSIDALAKYVSISEAEMLYALAIGYRYSLISGTSTKVILTGDAMKELDRESFYEEVKRDILNIFVSRVEDEPLNLQESISVITRLLITDYLYNMQGPCTVRSIIEDISASVAFIMSIRQVKALSLTLRGFGSMAESNNKVEPVSMAESARSLIKSQLSLLSDLGCLLVSSTPPDLDTTVLPDKEFIKIIEKPSEISSIRVKLPGSEKIKVLPDHEILVDIGSKFSLLAKIIRFADLEKSDRVCVLRITPKSITGALNDGMSANEIIRLLQGSSSTGLPENVKQTVIDVAGKGNAVNIIRCSAILRVDDPITLDRIISDKFISQMITERVDRNIVALKEDISLPKLVTDMRKRGFIVPFDLEEAKKIEKRRKYSRRWDW